MSTPTAPPPDSEHSHQAGRWPLAPIAIAGVLFVILVACADDSAEPTSPAVDAIAVVEASIDAWNQGNFNDWQAHHATPEDDPLARSEMIAGSLIELKGECSSSSTQDATFVECPATVADDFHTTGGLTGVGVMAFTVDANGLITDSTNTFYEDDTGRCCPEWQAFHQSFFAWLETAHPDVFAEIGPTDGKPAWFLPGVASGNPEHMQVALDYVGDFVAESDVYPLGQTAQHAQPTVEPLGRGAFVSAVSGELLTGIEGTPISGGALDDASDVVFAKITIPAGASAPWHTHTGPAVLVNIGPGTLSSVITTDCISQEVVPGNAFLDPGGGIPHTAVNTGDEDVVLYALFLGVVENPVTSAAGPDVCEISAG